MIAVRDDFVNKGPFTAFYGVDKALKTISEYRQLISAAVEQEANLKKGQAVFKQESTPNKEISTISADLDNLQQIWTLYQDWSNTWDAWRTQPFLSLDAAEMEESVQKFMKRLLKCPKDTKDWEVFQSLKEKVTQCKKTIPILQDLKNPALRDRHWQQIMEETGRTFNPKGDDFTLEKILEIGLDQYV